MTELNNNHDNNKAQLINLTEVYRGYVRKNLTSRDVDDKNFRWIFKFTLHFFPHEILNTAAF